MAQVFNFVKKHGLFVGDDMALTFEAFDDDLVTANDEFGIAQYVSGTLIDVSGWTFAWALRATNVATGSPLLAKSSGSGIEITGTFDAVRATNTQRIVVTIADTDTFSDAGAVVIPPKKYFYSLKRTNAGSEKTVSHGSFLLQQVPVRA